MNTNKSKKDKCFMNNFLASNKVKKIEARLKEVDLDNRYGLIAQAVERIQHSKG